VKLDRRRIHTQNSLILCNLKEAHIRFKESHTDMKVSFSTFYKLCPKWLSAGASGICVGACKLRFEFIVG
jgi:hypothetical protein